VSVKIAPWPELFRTATMPRCASMIFFTMARPGPRSVVSTPLPLPNRSNIRLLLVDWNSRTVVGNVHATVRQYLDCHLFVRRRMGNGIFDEVSKRPRRVTCAASGG
jgi:hypothetical protein